MISVILPTIAGREQLLEQTIAAYEETTDAELELVIVRGHPTCGEAWNAGAELATGDQLLLGADDLPPHHGWDQAALAAAAVGVYPAPWIVNTDGSTLCCGTLGSGLLLTRDARDGLPVSNSPIPFLARDRWPDVGPAIPVHCYSDDYLAYRARLAGLAVEVRRGYRFTHLDGQPGHARLIARSRADRAMFATAVSRL